MNNIHVSVLCIQSKIYKCLLLIIASICIKYFTCYQEIFSSLIFIQSKSISLAIQKWDNILALKLLKGLCYFVLVEMSKYDLNESWISETPFKSTVSIIGQIIDRIRFKIHGIYHNKHEHDFPIYQNRNENLNGADWKAINLGKNNGQICIHFTTSVVSRLLKWCMFLGYQNLDKNHYCIINSSKCMPLTSRSDDYKRKKK